MEKVHIEKDALLTFWMFQSFFQNVGIQLCFRLKKKKRLLISVIMRELLQMFSVSVLELLWKSETCSVTTDSSQLCRGIVVNS